MTLECIQQASIISGVSLSTFARRRHYYARQRSVIWFVSLLLAKETLVGRAGCTLGFATLRFTTSTLAEEEAEEEKR